MGGCAPAISFDRRGAQLVDRSEEGIVKAANSTYSTRQ